MTETLRLSRVCLCTGLVVIAVWTYGSGPPSTQRIGAPEIPPSGIRSVLPTAFDPVLAYETYLGGTNFAATGGLRQGASAMVVDSAGNTYIAGGTNSINFPVTPGVVQASNPQATAVGFVAKIDPTGQSLIFSTYVNGLLGVSALAVDSAGNIYMAGDALDCAPSPDCPSLPANLPIPPNTTPFQAVPKGQNIAVIKLNNTATTVLDATYLGGSGGEQVSGITVDAGGVYIAGTTHSNDFPTANPLQASLGTSGSNLFVTKLSLTLSSAVFSTYLGQNSFAFGEGANSGIAVDTLGDAYVIGAAESGFPSTSNALQSTCPAVSECAVLAKLNPSGSALLLSTYLSGGSSVAQAVAVDSLQNIYVGGSETGGFPQVHSLQSCGSASTSSGFVAKITAAAALAFSTCLGGGDSSSPGGVTDMVLDGSGNIYVSGAGSTNLPLVNPILQSGADAYVAEINPNTPALMFSSLVGATDPTTNLFPPVQGVGAIGVDSNGNIYGAGTIGSSLPVFNAFQPVFAGLSDCQPNPPCSASDAYILRILPNNAPAAALTPALLTFPAQLLNTPSPPQSVTVSDLGSAALTVSNATVTGDFSIANGCATVTPAGGMCAIQVTFTPTTEGTRTGILTITDNSAGSPRTVQLSGQAASPLATLSASSLTFPAQLVGTTSSAQPITITNGGAVALQILHLQASGNFAENNDCGTTLMANNPCTVNVTYTPIAAGSDTGTLTITDSAANSPQTVALMGNGTAPGIGLAVPGGGSVSASVTAGQSAMYTLSIGGAGASGTATLTCSGAPATANCMVPATMAFDATTATNFTATIATEARTQGVPFVRNSRPWYPLGVTGMAWLCTLALVAILALSRAPMSHGPAWSLRFVPLLAIIACACGGGASQTPNSKGTQAGTYTVTVTATSAGNSQAQKLTLIVK
jgi:Abnormal spindle-like microcephaly-assoc'd, ASPM-SPD-2-Hydin